MYGLGFSQPIDLYIGLWRLRFFYIKLNSLDGWCLVFYPIVLVLINIITINIITIIIIIIIIIDDDFQMGISFRMFN